MVIWGGRILKTVNETNGGFVYVLQAPLNYEEWPTSTKFSQGRFMARSSGFLDPEVYRKGAKITIAGELSGTETKEVDKINYAYPVVTLREVYFWREEHANYAGSPPLSWGWYGPYQQHYDNYHGDYYSPGNYDPNFDLDWSQRYDYSPHESKKSEHEGR
jgi:outer membrane lipoprotein